MKRSCAFRLFAGLVTGVVVALLLIEGLLRTLPIQDGIFADERDAHWPVHHLVPDSEVRWSAGWNMSNRTLGRTNNLGYVAPFDYRAGSRIVAVLGDSYVESVMNPYAATLAAQLQPGDGLHVYNFGIGGSALPDYLGLSTLLVRDFVVEAVVIVIGEGDFVEGFRSRPGHFAWASSARIVELQPDALRDPMRKAIRSLALVRYLRGNLKLSLDAVLKSTSSSAATTCVASGLLPDDRRLIESFVAALPRQYGVAPAQIVLLFDSKSARRALYGTNPNEKDARSCIGRDELALQELASEALRTGLHVVDTVPIFRRHFLATGERVDHSPEDWHWNPVGHRLAAAAASEAVRSSRRGSGAVAKQKRGAGL